MTIDDALAAALGPLVDGRAYPNTFPQEAGPPTWPAISYSLSAEPDATLCGGPSEECEESLIELEVVAPAYVEVRSLRAQVVAAMRALPAAFDGAGPIVYDPETKVHRAAMHFRHQPSSEPAKS